MLIIKNIIFIVLFFIPLNNFAQNYFRSAAIWDLSERKNESHSKTFAVQQGLKVAGMPFITTTDIDSAIIHAIIVASSKFLINTLTPTEKSILINYVTAGGILIAPKLEDADLHHLFGITGYESSVNRYTMSWNMDSNDNSLFWFDDSLEQTISLGNSEKSEAIQTYSFSTTTAEPLAFFEDNSIAITTQQYGAGYTYLVGFSFKDLILRNQLNRDYSAQRSYSNGFEPTTDTIMLFLRGIYENHIQFATRKHTSPATSKAALIVTHDVDSESSMLMMNNFADMENQYKVVATYNITTHYINDYIDGDYYTSYVNELQQLVQKGQNIGSHSVGHFPDFADSEIFPIGTTGNTHQNYYPTYDGEKTTGGTVFGELEVSKNLLETDLGVSIKSFRAGHLAFHKNLIDVLDTLNYEYNSTASANNFLTNFPFLSLYGKKYTGKISNIYEIPMTISDVFTDEKISENNWLEKVNLWQSIIEKNKANNAPTILLIHPNREFKIYAEEEIIKLQNSDTQILDLDSFGDYWRERDNFHYEEILDGQNLTLKILNNSLPADNNQSIIIKNGRNLEGINIVNKNISIDFKISDWNETDVIISAIKPLDSSVRSHKTITPKNLSLMQNYPNPFNSKTIIKYSLAENSNVEFLLVNIKGSLIKNINYGIQKKGINNIILDGSELCSGIYFYALKIDDNITSYKKLLLVK